MENLVAEGVAQVFCVPGESYLSVLDALASVRDKIRLTVCRHEAGAANMAAAYGKLTGRPGICFVTRGPGATHASVGVHTAFQDSAPMILFVGQVRREHKGREGFQEVDQGAFFAPLAKWAAEIDDPARIDEMVGRAFATACQGRPGPVVLALPEDMLREPVVAVSPLRPRTAFTAAPPPDFIAALSARLAVAERPLMILGGSGWTAEAASRLADWAEAAALPVALSFRRKDLLDNHRSCYAGDLGLGTNPKLLARVRQADLLIAVGARLGENPTQGYTLFSPEQTAKMLAHIHPDPEELGRVWPAALACAAGPAEAAAALGAIDLPSGRWSGWCAAAHADVEAFTQPLAVTGRMNLSAVFAHLAEALPADAILCSGAGNYAAWLHRFYRHRAFPSQLAPISGAMGFGFPAAIAAKLAAPHREVVAVAGDGCFLMTGQELATAVQYGLRLVVIVVDNGAYGTIRMHQERNYPGRTIGTDLRNPDFAAYAQAFGAVGVVVEATEDFAPALANARAAGGVALICLKADLEDISPGQTLTALRGG